MPQGANIPALHTWNIGATVYVDSVNGNDSTGTGATGAPWATLQKAHDVLKASYTWPTNQDLKVAIRAGTYQASGTYTLDTSFSAVGRAPSATRFLIWAPDTGHEGLVIIKNPTGSDSVKGAIRVGTNAFNSYQIFSDLELDGEGVRKGSGGNSCSIALYFAGATADANTQCEAINLRIHGFKALAPTSPSTAQGLTCEAGVSSLKVYRCRVWDMGTNTLTTANQEHGMYLRANGASVVNCAIYDCANGYGLQYFQNNSTPYDSELVANCTFNNNQSSGITIPGDSTNCKFINNIYSNHTVRGSSSHGLNFGAPNSGVGSGNLVDHTIYYNNTSNKSSSPSGWTFTNETTSNPLYVSSSNLQLSSGSPAIGYTDTNYAPTTDIDGTVRPAGLEDAGAYELFSGLTLAVTAGSYVLTGTTTTTTKHNWRIVAQTLP